MGKSNTDINATPEKNMPHTYLQSCLPSNDEYPQDIFLSRFQLNMKIRGGRDSPVANNLLSLSHQNMTAKEFVWVHSFEIK